MISGKPRRAARERGANGRPRHQDCRSSAATITPNPEIVSALRRQSETRVGLIAVVVTT